MSKIIGQLEAIITKSFGNGGDAVFIKVNGTEYKFGKFAPRGFSEGDWVEFDATSKQNGNYTNWTADYKTLRKSTPGTPNPNPEPVAAKNTSGKSGYNSTGNDDRQEIISKQAALNTGFNLFSKLVELGAIVPPTAVKKNGLYDFYKEAFHNEAAQCYKLSTGKTWDIGVKEEEPKDDFSDDLPEGDAW